MNGETFTLTFNPRLVTAPLVSGHFCNLHRELFGITNDAGLEDCAGLLLSHVQDLFETWTRKQEAAASVAAAKMEVGLKS